MSELGNRPVGDTIAFLFTTAVNGVPTDMAGSPAISIYKNSTTESTSGVTFTQPYDNRTGMAQVVIDTTASSSFYAAGNDFNVVVTTGTLGGVSMIGYEVGSFSLTTERTTLDKTVKAIGRGTVTSGSSTTSVTTSAFTPAGAVADQFKDRVLLFDSDTTTTALRGQAKGITASSNAATPTFTVAALTTTPASGDTFSVI